MEQKTTMIKSAALLMPTNNGKGYKVVINDAWFYTSKAELLKLVGGLSDGCGFRSREQIEAMKKPTKVPTPTIGVV